MAQAAVDLFCHNCNQRSETSSTNLQCPRCQSGFVELIEDGGTPFGSVLSDAQGDEPTSQDTTLRLLTNSLFNSFHDVSPPDGEDPNSRSIFQLRLHSGTQAEDNTDTTGPVSSSQQPRTRRRFNFRIGRRTGRPVNPTTSNESEATVTIHPNATPNQLVEGLLQQLLSGGDLQGAFGGNSPFGMFPLHGNPADYAWGANGIDDIITQLLGQLDSSGAPPAARDVIEKLPKVKITQDNVDKKEDCSVCMDTFEIDEEAKELPCEHLFHPSCIDKWLELHNTCPICRTNIETQQDSSCPRPSNHASSPNTSRPSTSGA